LETTALGAAWLAGMKAGVWPDQQGFAKSWKLKNRFQPKMDEAQRTKRYQAWRAAVKATINQQHDQD
jgi:glycerol kinase